MTQAVKANGTYAGVKPAVVIDVRTPAEFAAGHVIGAVNIPVDRIGEEIGSIEGIGKNSPILLYCRTGGRSDRARQVLMRQGYTHVINAGGLGDVSKHLPACRPPDC